MATSPAIDFFDDNGLFEPKDIESDFLGDDYPKIINFIGLYNLGADESSQIDIIFKDSFD